MAAGSLQCGRLTQSDFLHGCQKTRKKRLQETVRKRIKKALEKIEQQEREFPSLKSLVKYLSLESPNKRIKTGYSLQYRGESSDPVKWILNPPT
jgi:predicted Zn-dependent peptidase